MWVLEICNTLLTKASFTLVEVAAATRLGLSSGKMFLTILATSLSEAISYGKHLASLFMLLMRGRLVNKATLHVIQKLKGHHPQAPQPAGHDERISHDMSCDMPTHNTSNTTYGRRTTHVETTCPQNTSIYTQCWSPEHHQKQAFMRTRDDDTTLELSRPHVHTYKILTHSLTPEG